MSRPTRIEIDVITGDRKEIPLTDAEISEANQKSAQEADRSAQIELNEKAHKELTDYLMNFVASQPDAPKSVKDFIGSKND